MDLVVATFGAGLGAAILAIVLMLRQQQQHRRDINQLRAEIVAQKIADIGALGNADSGPEPEPPKRKRRHLRLIAGGVLTPLVPLASWAHDLWQLQRPAAVATATMTAAFAVTTAVFVTGRVDTGDHGGRAAQPPSPTATYIPEPSHTTGPTPKPSSSDQPEPGTSRPSPRLSSSPMGGEHSTRPDVTPMASASGSGDGGEPTKPPTSPPPTHPPEDGPCLELQTPPLLTVAACLLGQR